MIRLFRKIRHQLLSKDKYGIYILYATGEIILVVVGILLALQIDNWNQNRKDLLEAEGLFQELEVSLQKDLVEIEDILAITGKSVENQYIILSTPSDEILDTNTKIELITVVRDIWGGVSSFYPKVGIYKQILSSNLMRLIKSSDLQELLVEYYDYKCTRYTTLDEVLDRKFHETFQKFMAEDLAIVYSFESDFTPDFSIPNIDKLRTETMKVYDLTYFANSFLEEMKADIEKLLNLI